MITQSAEYAESSTMPMYSLHLCVGKMEFTK